MKKYQVIVAGGGASGCIAALKLKEAGIDTAILEGSDRLMKKLLVTGNGRCNITNENLISPKDVSSYFSCQDPAFGFEPLLQFDAASAVDFFSALGLPLVTLDEGKMYPRSLQASSVLDLIRLRLDELSVPVMLNARVRSILVKKDRFVIATKEESAEADFVIVAAGGQAMPATGSDGSFYKIAKDLGHNIIAPQPALVQLKTDFPQLRALSGVKADARLSLWSEGKMIAREEGELLFTDYGISGPPVLQLSRFASPLLARKTQPTVRISLFGDLSQPQVLELILRQRDRFPQREAQYLLNGIVHKKLIPVLLRQSGLDKMNRPAAEVPPEVYEALSRMLTLWEMTVTDTNGFGSSQSTLGGVDLKDVDHCTLESKKVPRLYFTGEILDVCGACGGFNLQWAWSSAFAAAADIISKKGRAHP